MESESAEPKGLFPLLDGIPTHGMVIVGVIFALLAPIIPQCRNAKLDSAEAEIERATKLRELDLKELKREQEEERRAESEKPPEDGSTMREREEKREQALVELEADLDRRYDLDGCRRDLANAKADAAGVRSHLVFHWLGRVLLVLGLLGMTLGSTGTRQKILLAVLLLVLFGSLTGISLDVGARAHLGG